MKVVVVIVCYRPDVPRVHELCTRLRLDGAGVIVVDNTERPYLVDEPPPGCELIALGRNTGIAHAQNVGVAAAAAAGADVIAFFDQDSTVGGGLLTVLVGALRLAAPDIVAPLHRDDVSGANLPAVRLNRYGLPRPVRGAESAGPFAVDVVISSGTVATKEVFEVAGTFDESLFIDFVDTEWCLRCRSKGVPIRVVPAAVMSHRIGHVSVDVRLGTLFVHSAPRCYYQVRNCFHLFRKPHVPALFALRETLGVFLSRALLVLFVSGRSAYVKAYFRGLWDGAKGVTGAMPA